MPKPPQLVWNVWGKPPVPLNQAIIPGNQTSIKFISLIGL